MGNNALIVSVLSLVYYYLLLVNAMKKRGDRFDSLFAMSSLILSPTSPPNQLLTTSKTAAKLRKCAKIFQRFCQRGWDEKKTSISGGYFVFNEYFPIT